MQNSEFGPRPPTRIGDEPSHAFVQQQLERLRNGAPLPSTELSKAGQAEADSTALLQRLNAEGRRLHDAKKYVSTIEQ